MSVPFSRTVLSLAVAASVGLSVNASAATEQEEAVILCEGKLREVYGLKEFSSVWADATGNHKFSISGNVRDKGRNYPFNCAVKNGRVKSYNYHGPHAVEQEGSGVGTAVAVGAGLAVAAAIAAAAMDDDNDNNKKDKLRVKKSVLEDACHDALRYRIRDEHYERARVKMQSSEVKGHKLVGEGKVKRAEGHHHVRYTCHFDNRGRVVDSEYYLY